MNGVLALGAPHYNLPPLHSLNRSLLEAPLTYDSYQDKFHTLLYYEEHEHEKVLRERLDKFYDVLCIALLHVWLYVFFYMLYTCNMCLLGTHSLSILVLVCVIVRDTWVSDLVCMGMAITLLLNWTL